jgi:sugar fermentation stimulation protein A
MKFAQPLIQGLFVQRYKRFFAEVQDPQTGEIYVSHCANSGKMLGLLVPGARCWILEHHSQTRKLKYTWELVESEGTLVGVNTMRPNFLVEEGIRENRIPQLEGYEEILREVAYGKNSRIDLLLKSPHRPPCYVEAKQLHLKREGRLEFPDCVTTRGAKHLEELADMVGSGARSVMIYVAQRDDGDEFSIATDLDPVYGATALKAAKAGVEFLAYACQVTPEGITLYRPLRVLL